MSSLPIRFASCVLPRRAFTCKKGRRWLVPLRLDVAGPSACWVSRVPVNPQAGPPRNHEDEHHWEQIPPFVIGLVRRSATPDGRPAQRSSHGQIGSSRRLIGAGHNRGQAVDSRPPAERDDRSAKVGARRLASRPARPQSTSCLAPHASSRAWSCRARSCSGRCRRRRHIESTCSTTTQAGAFGNESLSGRYFACRVGQPKR